MWSCLEKRNELVGFNFRGVSLTGRRTLLDLLLVFDTEHVQKEGWHGVSSDPQELVEAVVKEVETLILVSTHSNDRCSLYSAKRSLT